MDEIPTPETDAAYKQWLLESDKSHRIRMGQTMESFERRLTVAREALKKLDNWLMRDAQRKQIIEKALTLTAPKQCTKTQ